MNSGNWLDGYQPVDERIHEFRQRWPAGRIVTDEMHRDTINVVFRASVFKDDGADRLPDATGWAEEQFKGSGAKWAVENCETSAIGRALANLGLNPKGTRPSSLEMGKEARQEDGPPPVPVRQKVAEARRHLNNSVDTGKLKEALSALPAEARGKARALLTTTAGGYTTPLPARMDETQYTIIVDELRKAGFLEEGQP